MVQALPRPRERSASMKLQTAGIDRAPHARLEEDAGLVDPAGEQRQHEHRHLFQVLAQVHHRLPTSGCTSGDAAIGDHRLVGRHPGSGVPVEARPIDVGDLGRAGPDRR